MIYLDTHVVVWLYAGDIELLSEPAKEAIEASDLLISPACLLELQFLHEIGRISVKPRAIRDYLEAQLGLRVCELPFYSVVAHALRQSWTRDPFDRLIVAQACARGDLPLLSKDRQIREGYAPALW